MFPKFIVLSLFFLGPYVLADYDEPCASDELEAQFARKQIVEYEAVVDDALSIVITVPTTLPNVKLGGIFLIREDGDTRLLTAPLVQFTTEEDATWTSVALSKALAEQYTIAATYHLIKPYPDACGYEFKIPLDLNWSGE